MNTLKRFIFGKDNTNYVRVLRFQGIIGTAGLRVFNFRRVERQLDWAFNTEKKTPKAVCLEINSPGGSPVQSALIFNRIRWLSKERNIPVLAFVEDVAASGGYMVAISAQEIFVNEFSTVGSIGVVNSGFGLVKTIEKLGIERRTFQAGESKVKLDPFEPLKSKDVEWVTEKLQTIHSNFIKIVKERRQNIHEDKKNGIFEGNVFFGQEAIDNGLADNTYTDMNEILKKKFGVVEKERYEEKKNLFNRLISQSTGSSDSSDDGVYIDDILSTVEHKLLQKDKII